ncbi:MAG: carboxypeptidase-like regulatory domain-containing protein [Candidatus Solibacter sp.]
MKTLRLRLLFFGFYLLSVTCLYPGEVWGRLIGRVTDAKGQSVARAIVTIARERNLPLARVSTNDCGEFEFSGIVPGAHRLRVAADGFGAFEQRLVTKGSSTLSVGIIVYAN